MELLQWCNEKILWGIPMMILMSGCGLCLIGMTKGMLFRQWKQVLSSTLFSLFRPSKGTKDGVSSFGALSTALAATVGTGNIVGVSVALMQGGPGAIFWMWISALIGMMTKFSEVTLAVAYREQNKRGEWQGGPMYYIAKGIGSQKLSGLFCVFGVLCSFGVGNMVQSNAMAGGLYQVFHIPLWITGLVVALLAGLVLIGGMQRIARVTSFLVPFMALFYMVSAGVVLFQQREGIGDAFLMIFRHAFTVQAVGGGLLGTGIGTAIRIGVARGIFTNEAGLGSAPIAHASANTDHPVRQGMWGAFEVFFDTIVMCTVTALVLLSSPRFSVLSGEGLLQSVFAFALPFGQFVVPLSLTLFAFATVIAWYYYGATCMEYLAGQGAVGWYRGVYVILIFLGCVMQISTVWELADFFNGLMAVPNLIALFLLRNKVKELTENFFSS